MDTDNRRLTGGRLRRSVREARAPGRAGAREGPRPRRPSPKDATGDMATLLAMLYVLLGFSVVVSLFGVINTMVLSVFERTREIGMLRTIGTWVSRCTPRRG